VPGGKNPGIGTGREDDVMSSEGFVIRRAEARDRQALAPLVRAYIEFYREPQPPPARLDTLLAVLAERPEVGVQFVAEKDGVLRGFATVYLTYHTVAARRVAVMNDLFVAPDDRDVGLGRALIRQCHRWAAGQGCATLSWITADDNHTAQALYDKLARRTTWITYEMPCEEETEEGEG
jgi:GNAT superfamily N-acetyltransferase